MPYYCINCAARSESRIKICSSCNHSFEEPKPITFAKTPSNHFNSSPVLDYSEVIESLGSLLDSMMPSEYIVRNLDKPSKK